MADTRVYNEAGDAMLSHPVKEGLALEVHSTSKAQATLHKAGCKHPAESKRPFSGMGGDDYYDVAPCARRR